MATHRRTASLAPTILSVAAIVLMIVGMRLEGRLWWCACGGWQLWKSDVWSSHCSQHLADPYSITHLSHGLLIWCGLALVLDKTWSRWLGARVDARRAALGAVITTPWRVCGAVLFAAGWELLENSPMIIERYRSVTMSLDYMGDSVMNSVGDVACCTLGMFIAQRLGVLKTLLFFAATEIVLLWLIRDNLSLNVVMLLWPLEAIKQWQTQGHAIP